MPQILLMAIGCVVGMLIMGLRMYGKLDAGVVIWPCPAGAFAMVLFAANIAANSTNMPRR